MNGEILVYLQNRKLEDSTVVFLEMDVIIMNIRPKNVILLNRRNGLEPDWAQAACL